MGPQDGIDVALASLAELRRLRGPDFHCAFVGDGDVVGPMRELADRMGIGDQVEFAGWRGDDDIRRWLSTADVCLAPDPPGELNDVSTMAKIPEYMAMGAAIASFDLPESRISAGGAAAYAPTAGPEGLARCVDDLLEDPRRREEMGRIGRDRVRGLSWEQSSEELLAAYAWAMRGARPQPRRSGGVSIGGAAYGARHELR
jgi:glycosyltransferase involved in cell wall biosynthesis